MAKVLQFMSANTLYEAEPVKIERKKNLKTFSC